MKRVFIALSLLTVVAIIIFAVSFYVPLPVPFNLDFQVLYQADRGILLNIPLYDRAGQARMLSEEWGIPVDQVFVLPFPYPPWYAVFTLPLAFLPIKIAVKMWFLLNVVMLLISIWLLSDQWSLFKRASSFIVAPLFLPIFGALYVGQYVFPTILGLSLLIYSLRKQNAVLTAVAMALATFKPHIGLLILLAIFILLLFRRDTFCRQAVIATMIAALALFAIGFIADKAWPLAYVRSLFAFKDVSKCKLCVSFPLAIAQVFGWEFDHSIWIAAALLIIFVGLFVWRRRQPAYEELIASFVCITLLVNPYLQNYDFSYLLIPMFVLAVASDGNGWIGFAILAAFLLPWLTLGLFARAGNVSFLISTILLFVLMLMSSKLVDKNIIRG